MSRAICWRSRRAQYSCTSGRVPKFFASLTNELVGKLLSWLPSEGMAAVAVTTLSLLELFHPALAPPFPLAGCGVKSRYRSGFCPYCLSELPNAEFESAADKNRLIFNRNCCCQGVEGAWLARYW